LNICVVGIRYAIVPHTLGPIDFRIRKQRDDDRIHWTNSLAEARDKANMLASARHERPSPVEGNRAASIDDSSGTSHSDSISSFTLQVALINQRLSRLETDVAKIYGSRIWRTLVRIGGIINAVFRNRSTPA